MLTTICFHWLKLENHSGWLAGWPSKLHMKAEHKSAWTNPPHTSSDPKKLQQLQSQRRIVIPRTKCVQPKEISIKDRGHTVHRYLLEAKALMPSNLAITKASPGSLVASANICASRSNNFQKYVVHMKPVIVFFTKKQNLQKNGSLMRVM
jgi:hypothetical protein